MTHLEVLEGFYRDVWSAADILAIDQYFDPEAESVGIDQQNALRIEDMIAFVGAMHQLVENVEFRIVKTMTDGDWTAAMAVMRARDRATGKPVLLETQCMMRFSNGRIAEAHNCFDTLSFFTQLGLVPQDLTLRLLTGETIC